jgi:arylsulfatase A
LLPCPLVTATTYPLNPLMPLLLLVLLALATPCFGAPSRPPNVIVVLVDDLGLTDLSSYGSQFYETPNIDQLAKDGVKFTQAYSSSTVCSPTRAALLTGKYPARLHLTDWIPGYPSPANKLQPPPWQKFLSSSEITLAQQFKSAGYATALVGKWHLTPSEKDSADYSPLQYGFDINIGGCYLGQPGSFFSPYKIPTLNDGPNGEFLTDRESAEAVQFITLNQAKPFFLYLPHYAVHQPIAGKPEVINKFQKKNSQLLKQNNATYAALISSVDDSLGRIRQTLKKLQLSENTIIIFTSDNGGLLNVTDNSPARAGKGSAYEGGIRVPFIVYWPNNSTANSTNATPIQTIDIYPTVLEMSGIAAQPTMVDGLSLASLVKSHTPLARTDLFWHYPHYHKSGGATPHSAIRSGDYRLVHFYEDNRDELYNLSTDPSETMDLATTDSETRNRLRAKLDAWLKSVDAQLPETR